jgi:hypothetical protein
MRSVGVDDLGQAAADAPLVVEAWSPAGDIYLVQAVPVFGSAGPPLLGTEHGPASSGPVGLVNRLLARHARSRDERGFGAFVYRGHAGGPVVAVSDHDSMSQARAAALTFARAIENGTFTCR